jgi:iron complex outermembrane recepter protein
MLLKKIYLAALVIQFLPSQLLAFQTTGETGVNELYELNLENLMKIQVISVIKNEQLIRDTASAIHVLTSEDIRRSGVTNFAELMRMVPGMQVAQKNSSVWAITSRGFNSLRANKLLVLIDGRSVYSGLYAGVFWDQLDYLLEDIQRIEIIRGPGGTIWGANAVNGVVNIITKSTRDSQGKYISLRGGINEKYITNARYGGDIGEETNYRLYLKAAEFDGFVFANDGNLNRSGDAAGKKAGDDSFDAWDMIQGGFALDHRISTRNTIKFSTDLYKGAVDDTHDFDDEDINGHNLKFRWDHQINKKSIIYIQSYYNHFYRLDGLETDPEALLRELDMYDIDLVFSTKFSFHALTLGGGYQHMKDDTNAHSFYSVIPETRSDSLYSLFFQDEINSDLFTTTLGVKFEQNNYTGSEFQPTMRILKAINDKNIFWAAVTGSSRTPSRHESDEKDRGLLELDSEKAISNELGYRRIEKNFLLDTTIFYVNYDKMIGIHDNGSRRGVYDNLFEGKSYGVETSVNYELMDNLRIAAIYSFLRLNHELIPGKKDKYLFIDRYESAPAHQFNLHSYWDISKNIELDLHYYYVSSLSREIGTGIGDGVDPYSRLDLRLGWILGNFEIATGAQNLLEKNHVEYTKTNRSTAAIERNFYCQLSWRSQLR